MASSIGLITLQRVLILSGILVGHVIKCDGLTTSDTQNLDVQKFITNQINQYRRTVGAADMLQLSWDFEARVLAQKLTDRCEFRGPRSPAEMAMFAKTKKYTCGYNLGRGTGILGWNDTLNMWFEGRKNFQFGVDVQKSVGQYTAMIWAKTFLVGCGFSKCKQGTPDSFDFFACAFCPAGNVVPSQFTPYHPGQRCGSCPAACDDGLCTNPCLEINDFANCDTELFQSGCDGIDNSSPVAQFMDKCKATCQCKGKGLLY